MLLESRAVRLPALLIVVMILVSCGDSDADRRFANEEIPSAELPLLTTAAERPSVVAMPSIPAASPIPAVNLLSTQGAASTIYVASQGAVWSLPISGAAPRQVSRLDGEALLELAGSSDGAHVALLTIDESSGVHVRVVSANGDAVFAGDLSAGRATPILARQTRPSNRLSWSPSGDRLLIAVPGGGIVEFGADGTQRELVSAAEAPRPVAVAWSPEGTAIAFSEGGAGGQDAVISVTAVGGSVADPAALLTIPAGRGREVPALAWTPDGREILYLQRATDGSGGIGGDLFAVSVSGGSPRLVASGGVAAPVASVGTFALAPDGRSVAFTANVPNRGATSFHSLWIRQLNGPTLARVGVPSSEVVTGIEWTQAGLVWTTVESTEAGDEVTRIYRADSDGKVLQFGTLGAPATPSASPITSPSGASPASE